MAKHPQTANAHHASMISESRTRPRIQSSLASGIGPNTTEGSEEWIEEEKEEEKETAMGSSEEDTATNMTTNSQGNGERMREEDSLSDAMEFSPSIGDERDVSLETEVLDSEKRKRGRPATKNLLVGANQLGNTRKRQSQSIPHGPSPKKKVYQALDLEEEDEEEEELLYPSDPRTTTAHRRTAMKKQNAHTQMMEIIGRNLSHKWSPEELEFKQKKLDAMIQLQRESLQLQREMQTIMHERELTAKAQSQQLHSLLMLKLSNL